MNARQHVIQPVGGAEREARRLPVGHPEQVDAGEAIGPPLADDGGIFPCHQFRHLLQRVPEFVRQHAVDGHVAEVALRNGHEYPAVPGNQVAARSVESVDEMVGVVVANNRAGGDRRSYRRSACRPGQNVPFSDWL